MFDFNNITNEISNDNDKLNKFIKYSLSFIVMLGLNLIKYLPSKTSIILKYASLHITIISSL